MHFHGDGNRVAVVFDHEEHRQLLRTCGIQSFVKLALAGGAVAAGDVGDLVLIVADVLAQRRVYRLIQGALELIVVKAGFGRAHGLEELRAGGRRARDEIQLGVAPVGRHLAAGRRRIIFSAHRLEQHLVRCDAQHQAKRTVAIIGVKPVVSGLQQHAHRRHDALMPGPADLKEDTILALELDFAVVKPPRKLHGSIDPYQIFTAQAVVLHRIEFVGLRACLYGHPEHLVANGERPNQTIIANLYRLYEILLVPLLVAFAFRPVDGSAATGCGPPGICYLGPCGLARSRDSNNSAVSSKPASPWSRILGDASLKGSSVGKRSSQRCWVSFS